jgi:hypothetical protein
MTYSRTKAVTVGEAAFRIGVMFVDGILVQKFHYFQWM